MSKGSKIFGLFGSRPQQKEDLEAERDITDDVIEADFVPYACLFDPHSIATKNGEILQIIRLSGITSEGERVEDLRTVLRSALAKHIPNTQYALWIHTIRRRAPLMPPDHFPDQTSQTIDAHWRSAHAIDEYYVNELYLTVVRAAHPTGEEAEKKREFMRSLWPPRDMALRSRVMEEARIELEQTVTHMMHDLQQYGAHRLGVVERDGVMYGEHLEFLEQLINLDGRPMPLPQEDLSDYLTSGDVTFGFNAMEVRTAEGKRRFASILTIKEYKEVSLSGLDEFLEIPCELIVTQCFDFIGAKKARNEYEKQARYMTLSGDVELAEWSELAELTRDDGLGDRAFGQQQTSLFMIAPSIRQLEANIQKVRRALRRLGIVSVREDLRFEEMYWAQLPANFPFIARHNSVNTMHLAGFVKLARPPLGNKQSSAWGAPLMIFRNAQTMPCYFSFFDAPSPHTAIIGKRGRGRLSFTHTLLAHTRKWQDSRIWMIDTQGRSTPFMESIASQVIHAADPAVGFNPFIQPADKENIEFLGLWIATMMNPSGGTMPAPVVQFFSQLGAYILQQPEEKRSLKTVVELIGQHDPTLAEHFKPYLEGGEFEGIFEAKSDPLQLGGSCYIDISGYFANQVMRVTLCSYLMHRMTMALDGTPTIIVLDEGFELLNNPLIGPRVAGWMDYLQSKNALLVIGTSDIQASAQTGIVPEVMGHIGHRFLFADHSPEQAYLTHFGISDEAFAVLPEFGSKSHMVLHMNHQGALQLYQTHMQMDDALHRLLAGTALPEKPKGKEVLADLMGAA